MCWFDQFKIQYEDYDENEKISIFVDTIERFFRENPTFSW